MLSHIKIEKQIVFQYEVAKTDVAFLGTSLMYQQHRCQVTHALDISHIRPVVLKGAKDIYQGFAKRMHLLKKLIQMRKCPGNVLH